MDQKLCTKCGEAKSVEEFYKRLIGSKKEPGFHAQCKLCMKQNNQTYRTQHLDKIREKRKRYYDVQRELNKVWLSKNTSYFRDYRRLKMKGEDGISYPANRGANNRS